MRVQSSVLGKDCLNWSVWHAEECRQIKNVVWADDVTHQYSTPTTPPVIVGKKLLFEIIQAKKIVIDMASKVVIINPVPDEMEIPATTSEIEKV